MGHALIDLTTLLDRKIHRGWHKLVGEATDVSETITVELGGEVELIVQWCHSPATVAKVAPSTTPKAAAASTGGGGPPRRSRSTSFAAWGLFQPQSPAPPASLKTWRCVRFAASGVLVK